MPTKEINIDDVILDTPASNILPDSSSIDINDVEPQTPEQSRSWSQYVADVAENAPRSFAQGATFGTQDELSAGLGAVAANLMRGENLQSAYDKQLQFNRSKINEARQENPYVSGGSEIGGAVGSAIIGGGLVPSLSRLTAARPYVGTATTGGISGGIYGFGTGQGSFQERLGAAGLGGGAGMLAGPVGAFAAQKVVIPLAQRAAKLFTSAKNSIFGAPPSPTAKMSLQQIVAERPQNAIEKVPMGSDQKALSLIEAAVRKDFPNNYEEVLTKWRSGEIPLAELNGPNINKLAIGAGQYPAGAINAEKYFDARIPQASENMAKAVRENVSSVKDYFSTIDDVLESGRSKAAPVYEYAHAQIAELPEGAIGPEVAKAIKSARLKYPSKLEGLPDNSVMVLDYAKREIDDQIGAAKRSGANNFARDRAELKNNLLAQIDEVVPEYGQARAISGDYLTITEVMDEGKNFFKVDPELIPKYMNKLGETEKKAYKIGVAKGLVSKIDDIKAQNASPYKSILGSKNDKSRLLSILGPDDYKKLEKSLMAEDNIYKMRNSVLGGSATTPKAIAAAQIASGGADMAASLATGNVKSLGISGIKSTITKMFDGLNDKTAGRVSELLYETNPEKKLAIFSNMAKSKDLTETEKQIVKKVYFETVDMANAKPAGAVAGGNVASQIMRDDQYTLPDGRVIPRITVNPIKKP